WRDRWGDQQVLADSAAGLAGLPMTIGDWEGQALDLQLSPRDEALMTRLMARRYTSRLNASAVSILLVCGRPGPVSVHTPDVCYEGIGYEMAAAPVRYAAREGSSAASAQFWLADFERQQAAVPVRLRILWSWHAGGAWQAPDDPRLTFARFPVLYKLYVIREMASGDERLEEDRCGEF